MHSSLSNPDLPNLTRDDLIELETGAKQLLTHLSRHLVCMSVSYVSIDDAGQPTARPRKAHYSGFVIDHGAGDNNEWYFVTAGHVLDDVDEHLEGRTIKIICASFADYFGADPACRKPIPFDYESTARTYCDERSLGIDVGLVHLRRMIRANMEANGISPIRKLDSSQPDRVRCADHNLIGFPEASDRESVVRLGDFGPELYGTVTPTMIAVKQLDYIPEGTPTSTYPWFIGEVGARARELDISGMSGGPIIGFLGNGTVEDSQYWVVALQSRWFRERGIIYGCPIHHFMRKFHRQIQALTAQFE